MLGVQRPRAAPWAHGLAVKKTQGKTVLHGEQYVKEGLRFLIGKALFASRNFTKILPASKQELPCWPRDSVASCLPSRHPCVRLRTGRGGGEGRGLALPLLHLPWNSPTCLVGHFACCCCMTQTQSSQPHPVPAAPESERASVSVCWSLS